MQNRSTGNKKCNKETTIQQVESISNVTIEIKKKEDSEPIYLAHV
jgi:hypothetical protein